MVDACMTPEQFKQYLEYKKSKKSKETKSKDFTYTKQEKRVFFSQEDWKHISNMRCRNKFFIDEYSTAKGGTEYHKLRYAIPGNIMQIPDNQGNIIKVFHPTVEQLQGIIDDYENRIANGEGDAAKLWEYSTNITKYAIPSLNYLLNKYKKSEDIIQIVDPPEVIETDVIKPEVIKTEEVETDVIKTEVIETDVIKSDVIKSEVVETEEVETEEVETDINKSGKVDEPEIEGDYQVLIDRIDYLQSFINTTMNNYSSYMVSYIEQTNLKIDEANTKITELTEEIKSLKKPSDDSGE